VIVVEHPRIWRSAETGRYYKQPEPNVFEAQMIQPGDISEIEAVAIPSGSPGPSTS
jgi:hypothetical protein